MLGGRVWERGSVTRPNGEASAKGRRQTGGRRQRAENADGTHGASSSSMSICLQTAGATRRAACHGASVQRAKAPDSATRGTCVARKKPASGWPLGSHSLCSVGLASIQLAIACFWGTPLSPPPCACEYLNGLRPGKLLPNSGSFYHTITPYFAPPC